LKVSATDKATGKSQNITITASSGLTEEEVNQMRREAEIHAADDKHQREIAESRNAADNAVYSAGKIMREGTEKLTSELKDRIKNQIQTVQAAMQGDNNETLGQTTNDLLNLIQEAGTIIHQQAEQQPSGSNSAKGDSDQDVVDGEFKEA
jgi:molecular chaperone DnaK